MPSYDPIVVPEEPSATPAPDPLAAATGQMWQPLALAGAVVAGLLVLALLVRRGQAARKAQPPAAPARKRKAQPRKPARPAPPPRALPVPAEDKHEPPRPIPAPLVAEPAPPPPPEPEPAPEPPRAAPPPATARAASGFAPSPLFAAAGGALPPDSHHDGSDPAAAPEPETPPEALTLELEPLRLATTLSQASLRFCLTLANQGSEPLGPLAITASLSSPESPRSGAPDTQDLAPLPPGTTATIHGEARLPLAAIHAIRLGPARLFVPLLSVEVTARRLHGATLHTTATFLIGEAQGGAGFAPFPLDNGPFTSDSLAVRPA